MNKFLGRRVKKTRGKKWRENANFSPIEMRWGNVEELFLKLKRNDNLTITDLKEFANLNRPIVVYEFCTCGRLFKEKSRTSEYMIVKCSYCDKTKRFKHFNNRIDSKIPVLKLIRVLFYFTLNIENGVISEITELSMKTVNKIILEIQKNISEIASQDKIGGLGHIVQLDESCVGKRKYNVGRNGNQTWIFGGIDITTKQFFARVVPNRTAYILGNIVKDFVLPETIVHTDSYASYRSFFGQCSDYTHDTVNHKYNFVNPVTGAHTQNIENLWSQFKKFKRRKGYGKIRYMQHYLDEFRLRKKYDTSTRWKLFEMIINLVFIYLFFI